MTDEYDLILARVLTAEEKYDLEQIEREHAESVAAIEAYIQMSQFGLLPMIHNFHDIGFPKRFLNKSADPEPLRR